jgi:hypothetical protein
MRSVDDTELSLQNGRQGDGVMAKRANFCHEKIEYIFVKNKT